MHIEHFTALARTRLFLAHHVDHYDRNSDRWDLDGIVLAAHGLTFRHGAWHAPDGTRLHEEGETLAIQMLREALLDIGPDREDEWYETGVDHAGPGAAPRTGTDTLKWLDRLIEEQRPGPESVRTWLRTLAEEGALPQDAVRAWTEPLVKEKP